MKDPSRWPARDPSKVNVNYRKLDDLTEKQLLWAIFERLNSILWVIRLVMIANAVIGLLLWWWASSRDTSGL